LKAGRFLIQPVVWMNLLVLLGTGLVIIGCCVNIMGRFVLKHNWANQVTLYHDHTLITKGVYSSVRHPLYASLIWMLTGGSLIYTNYFTLLSVLFIFIPMMYYRARQEESLLSSALPGYLNYKQNVGMFFPNIFQHGKL
jgi:protein-S-isoprenylcysteine O-methyltransferase Ste14